MICVSEATRQDALRFYRRWYAPNNATLVVVTHDNEIAARADRVVEMSDGRVVS